MIQDIKTNLLTFLLRADKKQIILTYWKQSVNIWFQRCVTLMYTVTINSMNEKRATHGRKSFQKRTSEPIN